MKKRIVVVRGEVKEIARLMGCTPDMVGHALAFRKNTDLARRIRRTYGQCSRPAPSCLLRLS